MSNKVKDIDIKNRTYFFFDDIINIKNLIQIILTLFRMGWVGKKAPPTRFSPVTSTNVRIKPQNCLSLSFNPFDRLV